MTKANQDQPAQAAKASPTSCPHWGKGGSYIRDPETGIRTKVDAGGAPISPSVPVQLPESAAKSVAAKTTASNKGE